MGFFFKIMKMTLIAYGAQVLKLWQVLAKIQTVH